MSIASLTAVTNRVSQIQGNFERNTSQSVTFAETLQTAQQSSTPADSSFVVTPQALSASAPVATGSLPIGIMGTSIVLHSGGSIKSGFFSSDWAAQLPAAGQQWVGEIERAATDAGLDPRLLAAMVWQESRFHPDAVSHSGAVGLAQLMPGTADGLDVDPWDPVQNLSGGARYLAWTIEEFGSVELGLAAYNAGPGRVREADGIPNIAETQAYVPRVLDYYRQLGGTA
jgi:hypothetical protein